MQLDEVLRSDRRIHEGVKKDMVEMRRDITQFKESLSHDHVDFRLNFTNRHEEFMREIVKLQEQISVSSIRLNNHKEALKTQETIIETFKHNFEELYESVH